MTPQDILWAELNDMRRLTLIGGPCVIESEEMCFEIASTMRTICEKLGIYYIFKASFDKANRSSAKSFRGPGLERGLKLLAKVRRDLGGAGLTGVHNHKPTGAWGGGAGG